MVSLLEQAGTKTMANAVQIQFESQCEPPPGWDGFVRQNTDCLFYEQVWTAIVAEGYKAKSFYACLRRNGVIVFGVCGVILNFGFFRQFFSNMPYGGFLGDFQYFDYFTGRLEGALTKMGVHQMHLTQSFSLPDQAYEGYVRGEARRHVLNLDGVVPDNLMGLYTSSARRRVKRAVREGIRIRQIGSKSELPAYFKLYESTMKRNHAVYQYPRAFFSAMYDGMIMQGRGAVFFAEYQSRMIGGAVVLFSSTAGYLLSNVSDNAYLKYGPNDLLLHTVFECALARKVSLMDLMMSHEEDEALCQFKEKWGAKRHPFFVYEKNLAYLPPRLWKIAWRAANTRWGSSLVRFLRQRA